MKIPSIFNRVLFFISRYISIGFGAIAGNFIVSGVLPAIAPCLPTNPALFYILSLIPFSVACAAVVVAWWFFQQHGQIPDLQESKYFKMSLIKLCEESFLGGIIIMLAIRGLVLAISWYSFANLPNAGL